MLPSLLSNVSKWFIFKKKIRVDTFIFRLHYKLTAGFLLMASLLVTANALIGSNIQCIHDNMKALNKPVTTYCYVAGTYTVPNYNTALLGSELAHPGVGPGGFDEDVRRYHNYYIWVPVVLFVQGLSFYIVHFIWKEIDSNRLQNVICGLNELALKEDVINKKMDTLIKYITSQSHSHGIWFIFFVICEILNLIIAAVNMRFTDRFLGGEFTKYGVEVIRFINSDSENRTDPMALIFPKMVKCNWHMFGPSGSIQRYDALCVLAQNILNEKVYVFVWFWFMFLIIVTGLSLVYRLCSILLPPVRKAVLKMSGKTPRSKKTSFDVIVDKCSIGDWFLISHLGDNMDPVLYSKFIVKLADAYSNPIYQPDIDIEEKDETKALV